MTLAKTHHHLCSWWNKPTPWARLLQPKAFQGTHVCWCSKECLLCCLFLFLSSNPIHTGVRHLIYVYPSAKTKPLRHGPIKYLLLPSRQPVRILLYFDLLWLRSEILQFADASKKPLELRALSLGECLRSSPCCNCSNCCNSSHWICGW